MTTTLTIKSIAHHRNGISGKPFYVVLFHERGIGNAIATLTDDPGECYVLNTDKLAEGDIGFCSNSWRGDHFESGLRQVCLEWEENR